MYIYDLGNGDVNFDYTEAKQHDIMILMTQIGLQRFARVGPMDRLSVPGDDCDR